MNSGTDVAGILGSMTSMKGRFPTRDSAEKSRTGSYGMLFSRLGFAECVLTVVMKMA